MSLINPVIRWKRIFPKESGIDGHNAIVRRIYGLDGKDFPRLSIAVYGLQFMLNQEPFNALSMVRKEHYPDSLKIAIMAKADEDSFPENATLPFLLVDELKDIVDEAIRELTLIEYAREDNSQN